MNQRDKITELIQRLGKGEPFSPIDVDDAVYWLRVLRDETVHKKQEPSKEQEKKCNPA